MENENQEVIVKIETEKSEPTAVETGPIVAPKPKRVLTEAQRLAFMKGREKRLANIERKRQEKLEAQQVEAEYHQEQKPPAEKPAIEKPTIAIPDEFAEKVAAIVADKLKVPEKPKVKRTYRRKAVVPADPETTPPVVPSLSDRHFSWL